MPDEPHLTLPESKWPTEPIPSDPEAGVYERSTRAGYRRLAEYIDSQDETRDERLARMRAVRGKYANILPSTDEVHAIRRQAEAEEDQSQ